jgi:hypothetical protein
MIFAVQDQSEVLSNHAQHVSPYIRNPNRQGL